MHQGGQVVVGQHHARSLAADLGAGQAHGHADVGGAQGRCVVDAVAGHRHHRAAGLQGLHQAQLLCRRHPGVDADAGAGGGQRGIVQRADLRAGQGGRAGRHQAQVGGDAQGRGRVVAGDHHHPDAGLLRLGDGGGGLGPRRVHQAQQAAPGQALLQRVGGRRGGFGGRQVAAGHGQGAQGLGRQVIHIGQQAGAGGVVQRLQCGAHPAVGATRQHHRWRALAHQHGGVGALVVMHQGGHALALGAEGQLAEAAVALCRPAAGAQLGIGHHQRGLGRVALGQPGASCAAVHAGIAGQHGAAQQRGHLVGQRAIGQWSVGRVGLQHLAPGAVAGAAAAGFTAGGGQAQQGHLAAGQRAGLVGGDDRGAAQRLHRRQLLDHRPVAGHALHAQRQQHGDDGGQPLGHRRHRQRHAQQQQRQRVGQAGRRRHQGHRAHHQAGHPQRRPAQPAAQARHLHLQRRGWRRGVGQQPGDGAHGGGHAGGGDDGQAVALRHRRALPHHVAAVGQGHGCGQPGGMLGHHRAFAGERGFQQAQAAGAQQAGIGGHGVAFGQHQQVAPHQAGCRHTQQLAAAAHAGRGRAQLRQCGHGLVGARLLPHADAGVEHQHRGDHQAVDRHARRAQQPPHAQRHRRRTGQQQRQRLGQRCQRAPPGGGWGGLVQLVGAIGGQALRRVGGAQALAGVAAQLPGDRCGVLQAGVGEGSGVGGGEGGLSGHGPLVAGAGGAVCALRGQAAACLSAHRPPPRQAAGCGHRQPLSARHPPP